MNIVSVRMIQFYVLEAAGETILKNDRALVQNGLNCQMKNSRYSIIICN